MPHHAGDAQTQNEEPLLSAHVSTADGVARAIDRACAIGCTAMQIFVKNNMQWFAKPLGAAEVRAFRESASLRGRVRFGNEEGIKRTFAQFEKLIGLKRLAAIRMNDSKAAAVGEDRHEHIGKGKIGLDAFGTIMREPRFRKHISQSHRDTQGPGYGRGYRRSRYAALALARIRACMKGRRRFWNAWS